jgi:hypothetical protein
VRIARTASLRDVAFVVCTALDRDGVTAVLTGGSAATVYAPEAHQSRDLDFILQFRSPGAEPARVLAGLGYREESGVYIHPESPLTLDFPRGPLAVGGDLIGTWDRLEDGGLVLDILTPTARARPATGFATGRARAVYEAGEADPPPRREPAAPSPSSPPAAADAFGARSREMCERREDFEGV